MAPVKHHAKPAESNIVLVSEETAETREEMLVIDVLNQSEFPSLSYKVSFATIINPPGYT